MEETEWEQKNEETEEWPQGQHFKEEIKRWAKEEDSRVSLDISDAFWFKSAKLYCCHGRLNIKQ